MDLDPATIRAALLNLVMMIVSLSLHEWGHAFMADRLGDDTPRSQGRVTLNPLAHIDPVGTILVPLLAFFGFFGRLGIIGWAKPVMVNPSNFERRTRDQVLVTLAGPAMNVLLAFVATLGAAIAARFSPSALQLMFGLVSLNVLLIVFNLLPIPPLDGSKFLMYWFGMSEDAYANFARWGWILLLVLVNVPPFQYALRILFGLAELPFNLLFNALT